MKKYGIILAVLLFCCITLNAQVKRTPRERAWDLQKLLNLSDIQEANVEFLYKNLDEKIDAILDKNKGNREKAKDQIKNEIDKTETRIMKILTSSQKEKYQKLKEDFNKRAESKSANKTDGNVKKAPKTNHK